jgi:hypothetical protein
MSRSNDVTHVPSTSLYTLHTGDPIVTAILHTPMTKYLFSETLRMLYTCHYTKDNVVSDLQPRLADVSVSFLPL